MGERPTLDYSHKSPPSPRPPRRDRIATAIGTTLLAAPCLFYGVAGFIEQVFGEADVGGLVVWLILVVGLSLSWSAVKRWLEVRD